MVEAHVGDRHPRRLGIGEHAVGQIVEGQREPLGPALGLENARFEARAHRGDGFEIGVTKGPLNIRAEHVWDLP